MLRVRIAGVDVEFASDWPRLDEYAEVHLRQAGGACEGPVRVSARLRWHEGQPPSDLRATYPELRGCERWDRDLYSGKGRAYWFRVDDLRDLHLVFDWDGSTIELRGDYYHRLSKVAWKDRLRRLWNLRDLERRRRRRFTTLLYYLVFYPVFWTLEHEGTAHPVHAAAVDVGGRTLLLAGPSGVGKSTLCVALVSELGGRFLGDTFVLTDGRSVLAVPEPVLLDGWSQRWLGERLGLLERVPSHAYVLGRDGFLFPSRALTGGGKAAALVFPRRAPERFVRPVSSREAASRIFASNDLVNDLRRYRAFAAVLELLEPSAIEQGRLAAVERLVRDVPTYEVGLTPQVSPADAAELLGNLLAGNDELETGRSRSAGS
ncbi:MAG: hypothetical protein KatS3mg076_0453 [Candidatus Binatia bacterium]|nr:MAG: hypothetical protein KatS3mg076_0453 [Candidatus Binatia bacterium]